MAEDNTETPAATPAAEAHAEELGLPLEKVADTVEPSGKGGTILKADVEKAAEALTAPPAGDVPEANPEVVADERDQEEAQFSHEAEALYSIVKFLIDRFPGYADGPHADQNLADAKTHIAAVNEEHFTF